MENFNSIYKLNPSSDRYRVCPECKVEFMTNHLSRDFCCKKCANDYNNRKKREANHANDTIRSPGIPDVRMSFGGRVEDQPQLNNEVGVNEIHEMKEKLQKYFSVVLGYKEEVEVSWKKVPQLGLDLKVYDSYENIPDCDLKKLNYGNYSVVWTQPTKILITYQTNLLWL